MSELDAFVPEDGRAQVPASYGADRQMPLDAEAEDLVSAGMDIYGRDRQLAPHAARRWTELQ